MQIQRQNKQNSGDITLTYLKALLPGAQTYARYNVVHRKPAVQVTFDVSSVCGFTFVMSAQRRHFLFFIGCINFCISKTIQQLGTWWWQYDLKKKNSSHTMELHQFISFVCNQEALIQGTIELCQMTTCSITHPLNLFVWEKPQQSQDIALGESICRHNSFLVLDKFLSIYG